MITADTLRTYFESGDKPTGAQFSSLVDYCEANKISTDELKALGTVGAKVYDTLVLAQADSAGKADGTLFVVSETTDLANAGFYTFQSSEPSDTRFEFGITDPVQQGTNTANISTLQSNVTANDSDIFDLQVDLTNAENDIVSNKTEQDKHLEIMQEGSNAFSHAERVKDLGMVTTELSKLETFIDDNYGNKFAFAPYSKKVGGLGTPIPFDGSGDTTVIRNSTGDYIDKDNIIKTAAIDEPRFSYYNGDKVLLVEPTRSNYINFSKVNNGWSTLGSVTTKTVNGGIAPNGINEATKFTFNSSGNNTLRRTTSRNNYGTKYSASLYAKVNKGSANLNIEITDVFLPQSVALNSEWQRIELNDVAALDKGIGIFMDISFSSSDVGAEVLLWGAQLEEGRYSTSLIQAINSTKTRERDDVNSFDVSNINQEDVVIEAEFYNLSEPNLFSGNQVISIGDGTSDNNIQIGFTPNGQVLLEVVANSSSVLLENSTIPNGGVYTDITKVRAEIRSGDSKIYVNDVLINSMTDTFSFPTNSLQSLFLNRGDNTRRFYGGIKSIKIC